MNLQENISRIKSIMMITEEKNPHFEFIKKNGFKQECTRCDSIDSTKEGELATPGISNSYYLIINNKNSCSQFPLVISDYDKSSWSLSSPINPVGDALIVATFNTDTQIIENANVLLCDKLYTKEKFLNFKKVFKSNLNQDYIINTEDDDSQDGSYWIMLKNLTYQKMEEIINWINTGHQILSQNLIKKDKNDTLDIT
jgi:hypothetical protein